jgi:hypothetical protein
MVRRLLPGWFGELPGQAQRNRRLRRLTPQIASVQMMLAELVAEGRVHLLDGTRISCANYPGRASRSRFAGEAGFSYCPSKSQFVWDMRLVLSAIPRASRSAMTWSIPRREKSGSAAGGRASPWVLFADGGFWGRELLGSVEALDVELVRLWSSRSSRA